MLGTAWIPSGTAAGRVAGGARRQRHRDGSDTATAAPPHGPAEEDAMADREGYRNVSLWMDTVPGSLAPRAPLGGDLDVDVAIVGAGYTGLWTAYYLAVLDPSLRIAVLEREIAGFGASGRNGGWCSAIFAASLDKVARVARDRGGQGRRGDRSGTPGGRGGDGRGAAVALQRAMFASVDEVGRAAEAEGIDAHFAKGGTLTMATAQSQLGRVRSEVESMRAWGFGEEDYRWLDAREAASTLRAEGVLGAVYTPHCASLHPARLARGLAEAVERKGVTLHERTPVLAIEAGAPGRRPAAVTAAGRVRADVVVRATEGYTPDLAGDHRDLIPVYSLMIATEPLPAAFWDEVGWRRRETLTDGRHLIIYAQRTADGRIAMGGRGAPYHFASRTRPAFDRVPAVFDQIHRDLVALFPGAAGARITHRWGGPLGIPRDWFSSVGLDRTTGVAWAGGYVGDGVSTTNLAGRTLADLILERPTDLVELPWVGHRSRPWEPEPLRWLGVNAGRLLAASADRAEGRTRRPARRASLLDRLLGH
jgi:glycine/D-amino acid oxidase-like deaminating enzyme